MGPKTHIKIQVQLARGYININAVLFDDYELLDVYGPMELLAGCTVMPIRESKGKLRITFLSASRIERWMGWEIAIWCFTNMDHGCFLSHGTLW